MSTVLEVTGLSKSFGQVVVAESLDLHLDGDQVLGVVGPNGAGKSSLFGLITGDLSPDAGRIELDGVDITRVPAQRRCRAGIGRTYQVPRPFAEMTVFENVLVPAVWGAGLGSRAAHRRSLEVLDTCGLADSANIRAGALPLLARKRLEVARAVASGPRLLLLDEVAGGLTEPEVDQLVTLVHQIRADGVAIIWIEHVVHALTQIVDRLLCLAGGLFIADGEPTEVLADPAVRELYFGVDPETEQR